MALSSLEKLPYFVRTDPEVLATAAALCAAAEAYAAASPTWGAARANADSPLGQAVRTATVAHKAAVAAAMNREHDREQAEDEEDAHLYMASVQDGFLAPTPAIEVEPASWSQRLVLAPQAPDRCSRCQQPLERDGDLTWCERCDVQACELRSLGYTL
jgi:hypothetical protein